MLDKSEKIKMFLSLMRGKEGKVAIRISDYPDYNSFWDAYRKLERNNPDKEVEIADRTIEEVSADKELMAAYIRTMKF